MKALGISWTKFGLGVAIFLLVLLIGFEPQIRTALTRGNFARYRYPVTAPADLKPVIETLEKKISQDPSTVLERIALAKVWISKAKRTGDESLYDKAFQLAKESLTILPVANPQANLVLAEIYSSRHQFNDSIKLAKEVLKTEKSLEALSLLATCYLATGETTEGISIAESLVKERPSLGAYSLLALLFQAAGRNEEAEFSFSRALELEDVGEAFESARTRVLFARFYLKFDHFSKASDLLKEALHIVPRMPLALNQRGEMELKKGNYKKAQKDFIDAFTESRQALYLHHYGVAKMASGEKEAGTATLRETEQVLRQEVSKSKYGHRLDLAKLLLDLGEEANLKEAHELLQEEFKLRKSPEIYVALLTSFSKSNRWKEGYPFLESLLAKGLREPPIYELAAQFEAKLGNTGRSQFYAALAKKIKTSL